MPIGFSKSILSRYEAPAAAGSAYAFGDTGAINSGNKATYAPFYSSSPFSDSTAFVVVLWFRISSVSDIDGPATRLLSLRTSNGSDASITFSTAPNSSYISLYNGTKNNLTFFGTSTGPYTDNTAWQNGVMDGSWHCLMASIDVSNIASGYSTTNSVFIDGVNCTNPDGGVANVSGAQFSTTDYIQMRNNNGSDSAAYASTFESGATFEVGPLWIYDTAVDFTSATVRGYYYDSGNTDGFVDPGTDGTSGGATAPDVFLYHNGTTLTGSPTPTSVTTVSTGSGAINIIADTDGPGSGGTN